MGKDKQKLPKHPFVSICMPTFNRRPFIPIIIECFNNQTYPKDKMEWIIVDDGTDKIRDLVEASGIKQIKYIEVQEKMTLGAKRNYMHSFAKGTIIVYMDDDDYYPPDRVKHAVERLRGSKALCAGSSAMFIYFKHINKMYQFGPYGPNHATAATFAFKRELLNQTRFDEESSVAEERKFLKDYTIPFVQLDSIKSILVFSHNHNSFDKKELLNQMPNPTTHETPLLPHDIIKDQNILKFFVDDLEKELELYEPGKPNYKPDVTKQIAEIKTNRENKIKELKKQQDEYKETIEKINRFITPQASQKTIDEQSLIIQQLTLENNQLREQVDYLNNNIKMLIKAQLDKIKEERS